MTVIPALFPKSSGTKQESCDLINQISLPYRSACLNRVTKQSIGNSIINPLSTGALSLFGLTREEAIQQWRHQAKSGKRGRPRLFSELAITTALMVKRVFSMPLRALQGFIDSVFLLAQVPLTCPHYTCISKRAKSVDVSFKCLTRGPIQHLAIDATGLKVYGEGEWKVKYMAPTVNTGYSVNCSWPLIPILMKSLLPN